jgi:long-chain acyl-CoA synthetase
MREAERNGRAPRFAHSLLVLAMDRVVLRRLRRAFGGNLRYFVSGSAPMPRWLLEWFDALGLPVLEAYGASENIVPIALNRPGQRRLGSVGKPLAPNRVALAPDGEILVGGPGLGRPIPAEGAPAPGSDPSTLATGDYGALDDDGFLYVTGRKLDAFKSPGGIWIAPADIEARLRQIPCVEHAVLTSAEDRALVAILAIDRGVLRGAGVPAGTARDSAALTPDEEATLRQRADAVLRGVPSHSRPTALVATLNGFSIAGGELTTNLKVRRRIVQEKYRDALRLAAATAELRRASADAATAAQDPPVVVQA